MTKKPDFKKGTKDVFNSLASGTFQTSAITTEQDEEQTPQSTGKNPVGRPHVEGYTRTSVILNDEQIAKVREISGKENVLQKDIIECALQMFLDKYEAKNGKIIPQTKKQSVQSLI